MLDWVRSHQHIAPVKLLRSMVQSSSSSIPFRKRFLERFSAGITFFDRKDRAAAIVIDERNVQPGALLQEFQIALHLPARRRRVAYSRERGLSARRACTLFSVARSALSYRGRKLAKDAPVIGRMKALSAQYSRLWRAAGLQVPRKRPRKRISASRPRPQAPSGPNQVWSYDFVFDHCANGQQLKCLNIAGFRCDAIEPGADRGECGEIEVALVRQRAGAPVPSPSHRSTTDSKAGGHPHTGEDLQLQDRCCSAPAGPGGPPPRQPTSRRSDDERLTLLLLLRFIHGPWRGWQLQHGCALPRAQ